MRRFWKRDDGLAELERDLRARRAASPPAFIRALAQRAGGEARWLRPKMRFGLAAGLAVIALVAVASAGGFSAAQSTTDSAVNVIKKLAASSPTSSTVGVSAAAAQYRGKCGKPPKSKCKVSITDVSKNEGNSGTCTTAFTFTVLLDQPSDDPITVTYSTRNGTASAGSDYLAQAGTVVFAPGEQSKTITILVCGDTIKEKNETFFVDISSTDATVTRTPGKGTIVNDD